MFDLEKYLTELKEEQIKKLEALNGKINNIDNNDINSNNNSINNNININSNYSLLDIFGRQQNFGQVIPHISSGRNVFTFNIVGIH